MCNRLFAVLLVLGLVTGVYAGTDPDVIELGDILIHYTFDAADDLGGAYVVNWGEMGEVHIGEINSQSSDGYQYAPSLIGEGMVLTNDGPILPADPGTPNNELADSIDIESGTETDPLMAPFENKSISIWFRQDLPVNPDNHQGLWTGNNNYIFGSYCTYQTHIMLIQDPWEPGVAPDVLQVRAGGRDVGTGKHYSGNMAMMPITLGDWHHVVLTLENVCGLEEGDWDNALARTFVDGVQVGAGYMIRNSDAYKWSTNYNWLRGANVGGYQFSEDGTYEVIDGATVDDLAIYEGALTTAQVALLYSNGLQGIAAANFDTPEPATIALLGMGALALLRKRS